MSAGGEGVYSKQLRPSIGDPCTHNGRPAEIAALFPGQGDCLMFVGRFTDERGGDGFIRPVKELDAHAPAI